MAEQITYKDAGVDIDEGARAVDGIRAAVKSTYRPEVIGDIGGFGGMFSAAALKKMDDPILVSGTDGVGTKLRLAQMADKHDTVGIDLVAMCVNDVLACGAEPLFFLDYIAIGKLRAEHVEQVVGGIAEGCRQAGCALVGGEMAEHPGVMDPNDYDLSGFCVGVVDRPKMLDPKNVAEGDVILGLASTGVHSNGFSLVRKIVFDRQGMKGDEYIEELGKTIGEELLTPTRLYPKVCLPLIEKFDLHGMVHVTGGGFYDNIPRALPDDLAVEIDDDAWEMPVIFRLLQKWGNVDWKEMYRTFNMGIGMILIVSPEEAEKVKEHLKGAGEAVYSIGRVVRGAHDVTIKGGVFDGE